MTNYLLADKKHGGFFLFTAATMALVMLAAGCASTPTGKAAKLDGRWQIDIAYGGDWIEFKDGQYRGSEEGIGGTYRITDTEIVFFENGGVNDTSSISYTLNRDILTLTAGEQRSALTRWLIRNEQSIRYRRLGGTDSAEGKTQQN
jgi:hypothetical protein